jgi:hypothetical protein
MINLMLQIMPWAIGVVLAVGIMAMLTSLESGRRR